MFATFRLSVQEARDHKDLYFAGLLSQHDIDSAMGDATALARRSTEACGSQRSRA